MCCSNNSRENWVVALIFLAVLFSLGVLIPMIMVTYPGDECLLFVSVRGEALIYGHPAGCYFISTAHGLSVVAAIFLTIMFYLSKRRGPRDNVSLSNKSLRGSMSGFSTALVGRAKVSQTIIIFSIVLTIFITLTAIIILSGYLVTCGELQYETRRQIHGQTTLGTNLKDIQMWCWSLFRDSDFHTRFHFDHYELSGQWHGQYTAYRHGRPQTWTGNHDHMIDIPTGLEFSMAMAIMSIVVWVTITILLILLRRNIKKTNRKEIAESLEDAKIWASDVASISPAASVLGKSPHYESLRSKSPLGRKRQINDNSQFPSSNHLQQEASDTQTLLEHQQIVAQTHPDGTFFQTSDGSYVQLVQGVLRTVQGFPPPPQENISCQPNEISLQVMNTMQQETLQKQQQVFEQEMQAKRELEHSRRLYQEQMEREEMLRQEEEALKRKEQEFLARQEEEKRILQHQLELKQKLELEQKKRQLEIQKKEEELIEKQRLQELQEQLKVEEIKKKRLEQQRLRKLEQEKRAKEYEEELQQMKRLEEQMRLQEEELKELEKSQLLQQQRMEKQREMHSYDDQKREGDYKERTHMLNHQGDGKEFGNHQMSDNDDLEGMNSQSKGVYESANIQQTKLADISIEMRTSSPIRADYRPTSPEERAFEGNALSTRSESSEGLHKRTVHKPYNIVIYGKQQSRGRDRNKSPTGGSSSGLQRSRDRSKSPSGQQQHLRALQRARDSSGSPNPYRQHGQGVSSPVVGSPVPGRSSLRTSSGGYSSRPTSAMSPQLSRARDHSGERRPTMMGSSAQATATTVKQPTKQPLERHYSHAPPSQNTTNPHKYDLFADISVESSSRASSPVSDRRKSVEALLGRNRKDVEFWKEEQANLRKLGTPITDHQAGETANNALVGKAPPQVKPILKQNTPSSPILSKPKNVEHDIQHTDAYSEKVKYAEIALGNDHSALKRQQQEKVEYSTITHSHTKTTQEKEVTRNYGKTQNVHTSSRSRSRSPHQTKSNIPVILGYQPQKKSSPNNTLKASPKLPGNRDMGKSKPAEKPTSANVPSSAEKVQSPSRIPLMQNRPGTSTQNPTVETRKEPPPVSPKPQSKAQNMTVQGDEREDKNLRRLEMTIHLSSRNSSRSNSPVPTKTIEKETSEEDCENPPNNRMEMRIQHDLAKMAGMKISQF